MSKQTGSDCLLKIGTDDAITIRDADLTMANATVDVTARDSGKFRERLSNIKEWSISGTMLYKKTDAAMIALRAAFLAGTKISKALFIFLDLEGFRGDVHVTAFDHSQPLEDGVTITLTLEGTGILEFLDPVS